MSYGITGVFEEIGWMLQDIGHGIKEAGKGIARGVANVGRGIASGVSSMGKGIAVSLSELGSDIAESFSDIHQYGQEQRRLQNQIYDINQGLIAKDEAAKDNYIKTLTSRLSSENEAKQEEIQKTIDSISNKDKKVEYLHDIIDFKYKKDFFWQILNQLEMVSTTKDVELQEFEDFYREINSMKWTNKNIQKNIEELDKFIEEIKNYLEANKEKEWMKSISKEKKDHFINLNHQIENPVQYYFMNDFAQYLQMMESRPESKSIDKEQEEALLDMMEKLTVIVDNICGLSIQGDDYTNVTKAFSSAIEIINKEELSNNDKYNMGKARYDILDDYYKAFEYKYAGFIEKKKVFENEYYKYFTMLGVLGGKAEEIQLTPEKADEQIAHVKELNAQLEPQYKKEVYIAYTKNKVHELMMMNNYKLMGSTVLKNGVATLVKEIYSIGNGNIVEVTIADNFTMSYKIKGVKTPGFAINTANIKKSMNIACPKMRALQEALMGASANEENSERGYIKHYDADEATIKEIELPSYVSEANKQKIYAERRIVENPGIQERHAK